MSTLADAHETWVSGKVVSVRTERGKVTIEHEPIANLEMMAMTMPFTAADPSLLEGLAAGDEIEFVAGMDGDELILVSVPLFIPSSFCRSLHSEEYHSQDTLIIHLPSRF